MHYGAVNVGSLGIKTFCFPAIDSTDSHKTSVMETCRFHSSSEMWPHRERELAQQVGHLPYMWFSQVLMPALHMIPQVLPGVIPEHNFRSKHLSTSKCALEKQKQSSKKDKNTWNISPQWPSCMRRGQELSIYGRQEAVWWIKAVQRKYCICRKWGAG